MKAVLFRRGVVEDVSCPLCEEGEETLANALLFCEVVRTCWFRSNLGIRTGVVDGGVIDFLQQVWQGADDELVGVDLHTDI